MTTSLPISEKSDLIRLIHEREQAIRAFGVQRLGLFGSFQRDEARADSDIDLFVEFAPGAATFDHFMDLSFYCDDLFGRRVEIVTPNSLSPYLGPRILAELEYVVI
ncbi:nucleotidyltransferase family protein [Candidatus Thiosymbion oneisti]|uniref:nucleotidyltransferase family protein n=1 Tax=Candidatus Thiosymbion oneisti TaxID=589554 RepID=UPI00105D8EBB|nr:nucleotidyltransferase family protein [Candidatus Thiosymbion oneisti]